MQKVTLPDGQPPLKLGQNMVQLEARLGGINPEPITGIPLIHPRTLG